MKGRLNMSEVGSPSVSVVMPVFNGAETIGEAIQSVFHQTYEDWELLVVDDGSTDGTLVAAHSFTDERVRVLAGSRRGFSWALNTGLRNARGKFLARLDADDIALPTRLETQLTFLDAHPEVALVGALAFYRQPTGGEFVPPRPGSHSEIQRFLLRDNPFIHSSVVFRREILTTVGDYNTHYTADCDYDLWVRVASVYKTAIIQEPLVIYRLRHLSLARRRKRSRAILERSNIQLTALRLLGPSTIGLLYLFRSLGAWMVFSALERFVKARQ